MTLIETNTTTMKIPFTDENGTRLRFNETERTIPEIWDALGRVTPIEVRTYEQGDAVSILVTQVCKGVAYGYPLKNGLRQRNDWYTDQDTTAVRIPDGGTKIWLLVDMPFDNVDMAVFRADLAAGNVVEGAEPQPGAAEAKETLDEDAVVGFGKYRNLTVGQLRKKDPSYLSWALENIERFRERVMRRA